MTDCKHPIWRYESFGLRPQRHSCIDCGEKAEYVPDGSVMVGHAPGECDTCDKHAEEILPEDKARWIEITNEHRR